MAALSKGVIKGRSLFRGRLLTSIPRLAALWPAPVEVPAVSPHRYWRFSIFENSYASGYGVVVGEVEMRESVGGADVTGSGTASASSSYSAAYDGPKAFVNDGDTSRWASNNSTTHWLQYDFGAGNAKAIVEVAVMGADDSGNSLTQNIGSWSVEYSDDGTTFYPAWWVLYPNPPATNQHAYVGNTFKTFTMPPAAPPARYWALIFGGSNGGTYVSANEIEMRESPGGADVTGSGTAASRTFYSGKPAAQAFDNSGLEWASDPYGGVLTFPQWLRYDFGAGNAKDIREISYLPSGSWSSQSPTSIHIAASDDGITYRHVWSVTGITGWASGVAKIFTKP